MAFIRRDGFGNASLVQKVRDPDGVWRQKSLCYLGQYSNLPEAITGESALVDDLSARLAAIDPRDFTLAGRRYRVGLQSDLERAQARLERFKTVADQLGLVVDPAATDGTSDGVEG